MSQGAFDVIRGWVTPHLKMSISMAVPLWAERLSHLTLDEIFDHEINGKLSQILAEKGDVLQFGGKGCAEAFNALAEGIARLAYVPGGVCFCGLRFEYQIGKWREGKHGVPDPSSTYGGDQPVCKADDAKTVASHLKSTWRIVGAPKTITPPKRKPK